MKKIYQGDTWKPAYTIYIVDADTGNKSKMDCSNYTVKMFIKQELEETGDPLHSIDASWTGRTNGEFYIEITHAISKGLDTGVYFMEIKLYHTASQTLVKTFRQDKFKILPVLEKDVS